MTNAMYVCYLVVLAAFVWLCYRFGFVAGWIEELEEFWQWCMGQDLSEDDPAPEDDDR